jgi:hypothetical protein
LAAVALTAGQVIIKLHNHENLKLIYYEGTKRFTRLSATVTTLFPVPPVTPANERETERKKMRDRDTTFDKKCFDEELRDKKLYL